MDYQGISESEEEEIVILDDPRDLLSTEDNAEESDSYCSKNKEKIIAQSCVIGLGSSVGLGGIVYFLLKKEPMLALMPAALIIFSLIIAGIIQCCSTEDEATKDEKSPLMMRSFA
jgi:hypothetical protein